MAFEVDGEGATACRVAGQQALNRALGLTRRKEEEGEGQGGGGALACCCLPPPPAFLCSPAPCLPCPHVRRTR